MVSLHREEGLPLTESVATYDYPNFNDYKSLKDHISFIKSAKKIPLRRYISS